LTGLDPVADVPAAFADLVVRAMAERPGPRFGLVLSGGPLARTCYERLAANEDLDWSVVDLYLGDERMVPADDPDANQRLVREALVDKLGTVGSFSPMPTTGDPDRCATEYQTTVAAALADGGFDLVHLGMGPDGHTASLFPGAPSLDVGPERLVVATEDPNGTNPHPRLTLTLPAIARARHVVFTVTGAEKRGALARVRAGDDLPAARVQAPDIEWLVDAAALGDGS
jgi:6-phosphogluconolactonase